MIDEICRAARDGNLVIVNTWTRDDRKVQVLAIILEDDGHTTTVEPIGEIYDRYPDYLISPSEDGVRCHLCGKLVGDDGDFCRACGKPYCAEHMGLVTCRMCGG